jgi:glycerol-3-phosphate dehydrogenase
VAESTDRSIIAELHFVLKNECIYTLSDFLIRRTGMLYFESEKITNELCEKLNDEIGRRLKKTTEQNQQSIEAFKKEWRDSKSFE